VREAGVEPSGIRLAMQPAADWVTTFGESGVAACTPNNPVEKSMSDVCTPGGPAVRFAATSSTPACCACIGRKKSFVLSELTGGMTSIVSGMTAILHGTWFSTEETPNYPYSLPSFRIDPFLGGTQLTSYEFVAYTLPHDNCGNIQEQHPLPSGPSFDFPFVIFSGKSFDRIDVVVESYACGKETNAIMLGDMVLTF
jgi:hypothetical protein